MACFISTDDLGLTGLGPEAVWANREYHGYHTLLPDMAFEAKKRAQEEVQWSGKVILLMYYNFESIHALFFFFFSEPNTWCLYNMIT